jgi:putative type II/III system pilus formation protein
MANAVIRRRDECNDRATGADLSQSIYSTLVFMLFLSATPESFADSLAPLTVEHPPKQEIVLTQGISTTIHSQRPFGKISITNPEVVDLVLQTDKSAVLIPERLGRTNVDFLDDNGSIIGSMDIVVTQQSATDRVVVMITPPWGLIPPTIADRARARISMRYPRRNKPWPPARQAIMACPVCPACPVCLLNELGICRPAAWSIPAEVPRRRQITGRSRRCRKALRSASAQ